MDIPSEADFDLAAPFAASMIQSLRAVGYDLPTAIADLIDNSITAGAKNVSVHFHWSGALSHVAIIDDGDGMSDEVLVDAMRIGSRNPLERRSTKDLGRFGLGLKTASFSQCKRLAVMSRTKSGAHAVRCWDLDYVTKCKDWRLLRLNDGAIPPTYVALLTAQKCGTVVLWENLDRITGMLPVNDSDAHDRFLKNVSSVEQHVAMVFHRFLERPRPLKIFINGKAVRPWNPFLKDEEATQLLTEEAVILFGDRLDVRPYVLPHHSKTSQEVYEGASGPRGWYSQQGFYVYRNERLLVAGDWLGLGLHKAEHYKLARIMLDIPNSMDPEWEIDVKKSRATPPAAIRKDLARLATITRNRARDIYRHRGSRLVGQNQDLVMLWEKKVLHGTISYSINRKHPLVAATIEHAGGGSSALRRLLTLIEETVPVPTIIMDGAEAPQQHTKPFQHCPGALDSAIREAFEMLTSSGLSVQHAKSALLNMEPFCLYPELIIAIDTNC